MHFSLLMATCHGDNPLYLKDALASLFEQTVKPSEIVIVGDGPIPSENRLLIDELNAHFSVRFIPLKERVGLGGALRQGLTACRYPLVARFDTDDICEPQRFETQLKYMESHPNVDVCGSYATIVDESGIIQGELQRPLDHESICKIIWSCPVIHPSVMMRKERILGVGNYRSLLFDRQEDYELWVRSVRNGIVFNNIPHRLIRYRRTGDAYHSRNSIVNGFGRLWYGLSAWFSYDRRPLSLLALIYPTVRPLLPRRLNNIFFGLDPREK
ncbi:MAG: glycosyltransferase [Candidatus Sedimenticola sp. PURPLELP]